MAPLVRGSGVTEGMSGFGSERGQPSASVGSQSDDPWWYYSAFDKPLAGSKKREGAAI